MQFVQTSATFTRPTDTTTYGAGDLIANNTSNASVTPMTFTVQWGRAIDITAITIKRVTNVTTTGASFRLWLFSDLPTVTNGDNAAFAPVGGGTVLGYIDCDSSTGSGVATNGGIGRVNLTPCVPILVDSDQVMYGLLEARGAYVPTNGEVITVTLTGKSYV